MSENGNTSNPGEDAFIESSPLTENSNPILTQPPVTGVTLTQDYEDLIREEARKTAEKIVQGDKASLINVFGIFASIVAFISIEIQILKQICDFQRLLGFSSFILAGLLSFIFILQFIMKSWVENDRGILIKTIFSWNFWKELRLNISLILAILTIISLFSYSYVAMKNADSEYICKDLQIQQKFSEVKDRLENIDLEQYKKLNDKIESQQNQINSLLLRK